MSENPIFVTKQDGSSEVFDSKKLFRGIVTACTKRPVSSTQMHGIPVFRI